MARKLTDEERAGLDYLQRVLSEAVKPAQKNKAAAVASKLVRCPGDVITEEDLARILKGTGRDRSDIEAAVRGVALDLAEGEEAGYTLRIPEGLEPLSAEAFTASDQAEAAEGQEAEGDAPEGADVPEGEGPADEGEGAQVQTAETDPADADGAGEATDQDGEAAPTGEASESGEGPEAEDAQPQAEAAEAGEASEPAPAEPAPASRQARRGQARRSHTSGNAPKRAKKGGASNPQQLSEVPYVRRGGPPENEVRGRILELDQRFWMNGWLLSHPGAYTLYERELTSINDALVNGALPGDITRRQLAYQMGGDEKFFEYGSDGLKLLRAMGMEDLVRHRPLPKPDLLYHAPRRRKHMRVLVTENLDPWLDVHDLMYEEGRSTILGERIHAVVLGGGTPILEHNRLALLLDTLRADSLEVLYWGDIDRAGVDIMVRLRDVLGDGYPFKPFTPAYQLMVERAMERYPDPRDNERTGQESLGMPDLSMLCDGLTDEAAAYVRAVVEGCRLVPQEILTRRDL